MFASRRSRLLAPLLALTAALAVLSGTPDAPAGAMAALDPLTSLTSTTAYDEMTRCAKLGPKHPGMAATKDESQRIARVFRRAGFDTSYHRFHMPGWSNDSGELRVITGRGGKGYDVRTEALAYSGTGSVKAEVVDLGDGTPADYRGVDVRGKVVMVDRALIHRTRQVRILARNGGIGMLYVSEDNPEALTQTGAVSWAYNPPAAVPVVSVSNNQGTRLRARLEKSGLRVRLSAEGERPDVVGRNVIGVRRGTLYPDKYVVVAGHYDSWYSGAVDNCSGVGTLLEMAERFADVDPAYTVIFAGWDAEEPGLVGSYAWIADHPKIVANTVLNLNLEMTAAKTYLGGGALPIGVLNVVGITTAPVLATLTAATIAANAHIAVPVPLTVVREVSDGIIPTDLEGFYASGAQGMTSATQTPYYHTTGDTADTIDASTIERVTGFFSDLLSAVQAVPPAGLTLTEVPTLRLHAEPARAGGPVRVTMKLRDVTGDPMTGAAIEVVATQHGSFAIKRAHARDLGGGRYAFTVPAGATDAGKTWVRAMMSSTTAMAYDVLAVDQSHGGVVGRGTHCRPTHASLRIRKGVRHVRATVDRGSVAVRGRRIALDLRRVHSGEVALRLTGRTSAGKVLRQLRTYRSCGL